jgi:hypothetical protein
MRCEINPTPPTLILLFLETITKQICCLHGHEVHPRSRSADGPLPQQPPTPSVIIRSSAGHSTVRHPMPAHDRYAICMSFGSIYRPRHTLKHGEPLERCRTLEPTPPRGMLGLRLGHGLRPRPPRLRRCLPASSPLGARTQLTPGSRTPGGQQIQEGRGPTILQRLCVCVCVCVGVCVCVLACVYIKLYKNNMKPYKNNINPYKTIYNLIETI